MSAAAQRNPGMTDAEWQTRCTLAMLYRVVDHLGWTDLINTHMSARIPGEPAHFLINNYGELFDEVTASSLVKMDLDGQVLDSSVLDGIALDGRGKFNAAGFTIHSGVYKGRPDANCVMHTHTRAGAALSVMDNGLRPISQDALQVLSEVAYHPYGPPATQQECDELARNCQNGSCLVLLNHGLLTLAPTMHGAFFRMWNLERAAELEVMARTMGVVPVMIDPAVVQTFAKYLSRRVNTHEFGLLEFQAIVRKLERNGVDCHR